MASDGILGNAKELWAEWNIRGFIILSLSLQAFLVLFAPLRKSTSNFTIGSLIWLGYLSADWVATFLVGHIATTQQDSSVDHGDVLAFWAAFLLVHLGGPGTITALNLEDNSLWVRHLFSLILQAGTIVYIFVRVMPNSILLVPMILIFISGIIKYSERTAALYLASTGKLKVSMLNDSLKLMSGETEEPYDFGEGDPRDDAVLVKHAHHLYEVSRGVIVDLIISFKEQSKIQEFFQKLNPEEALKLISIELNFFYEVLYTKASLSHSSLGLLFRCLSLGTVIAAVVWFLRLNKDIYSKIDVKLSYALLFGAIVLDGIGLLLVFFSDWPIPKIASFGKIPPAGSRIKSYFTIQKTPNWVSHKTRYEPIQHSLAETRVFSRRWSESIPQYSLISYALKRPSDSIYSSDLSCFALLCFITKIFLLVMKGLVLVLRDKLAHIAKAILGEKLTQSIKNWRDSVNDAIKTRMNFFNGKIRGLKEAMERSKYVYAVPIPKELWDLIFEELKNKSTRAINSVSSNKVIRAKGGFVLEIDDDFKDDRECEDILHHNIGGLDFDEIVLLWHIATELLYHSELCEELDQLREEDRIFSKILSDYMSYLLVMKPTMMSTVAGAGQIRYRDACTDTCAVAKQRLENHIDNSIVSMIIRKLCCGSTATTVHSLVCDQVLKDKRSAPKLHKSKSAWSNACGLAKALKERFDRTKRWRIVAKVWVEALSYAASHCKGEAHAQALSSGGELITFVWLLMVHLGLSQHENIEIVVADKT